MTIGEILRYVCITMKVVLIVYTPLLLLQLAILAFTSKKFDLKQFIVDNLFLLYILALLEIIAFRFGGIGWSLEKMMERDIRVNTEPLKLVMKWVEHGRWWYLFYNIIGNCIWFVPLGFLLPIKFESLRKRILEVTLIGTLLSMMLETLQFVLCTGVTDLDDVMFNSFGTWIGYVIYRACYLFLKRKRRQKSKARLLARIE